jgi:hypothetical protein
MFSTRICSRSALVVGASSSTHVVRTRARFPVSSRLLAGGSACLLASLVLSATALATPIAVNLRVEGSSATLFEGSVTTDAEAISAPSSGGSHQCDLKDNGSNGGFGASSGTPTTALHDAAIGQGLNFDATWSSQYNDFLVSQVGSDVNGGAPEYPSWGYAVNYTTAGVGGCQFQLAPGSDVLWAYNYFNLSHLLNLNGPASVNAGTPFTVHVTDGQTGQPISEAAVGQVLGGVTTVSSSSPMTDAGGNATVVLTQVGTETLKATRNDSVRSNGLMVCVHNGNDGTCGTTVPGVSKSTTTTSGTTTTSPPPIEVARVAGVKNRHVYSRHSAPRILEGIVDVPTGDTLHQVLIRIERRHGGRCFGFSGRSEKLVRVKCGTASFFSVGGTTSFSYLLPARLPSGRYVYDIKAIDNAGHPTKLVSGVSHVVFYVK